MAEHASEPRLRAVAGAIAPEELGHARLSRAIDRWGRSRLGREARGRLVDARRRAAIALAGDLQESGAPAELSALGLPPPDAALALARSAACA